MNNKIHTIVITCHTIYFGLVFVESHALYASIAGILSIMTILDELMERRMRK